MRNFVVGHMIWKYLGWSAFTQWLFGKDWDWWDYQAKHHVLYENPRVLIETRAWNTRCRKTGKGTPIGRDWFPVEKNDLYW